MISHRHKCIFIHIPKCAGTSIEMALGHFDGHEGRGGQDHRSISEIEKTFGSTGASSLKVRFLAALGLGSSARRAGSNPNNRLIVTRQQFDTYFKFAIVRNPWARAYSLYNNIMRDELKRKRWGFPADLTLNGFLRHHGQKGLLRPQTHWLKSLDGSISLDFIGRFENLGEDFTKACEMMNLHDIELPHEVRGTCASYQQAYDEESAAIIADACSEDLLLFGYSFERG